MTTAYDVPANDLINATSEALKQNQAIKAPSWMSFAKTGAHKERAPEQADFWYIRAAALLRKEYVKGPLGVARLRTEYGGKKNRGCKPEEHRDGSGKIIRVLLQQLEEAGYVKKGKNGRELTSEGQKLLDNLARTVELSIKKSVSALKEEKPQKEEKPSKSEKQAPEKESQSKPEESKPEEPKEEKSKPEDAKEEKSQSKSEESKPVEPKEEESKSEKPKEEPKSAESTPEEPKPEESTSEEPKEESKPEDKESKE